ncbi:hypothetical protein SAMN05444373_10024 [Thermoclostridium caenicola]|uniref:Uncharacterized protein n=1 Tax=Thermoclostridium caenicola TaxID=659425 RepID=A0A1M6AY61_9FIRM|nr:hypothetical protein SAMN05444373_10024 [Thermoclostridium caenicola]
MREVFYVGGRRQHQFFFSHGAIVRRIGTPAANSVWRFTGFARLLRIIDKLIAVAYIGYILRKVACQGIIHGKAAVRNEEKT